MSMSQAKRAGQLLGCALDNGPSPAQTLSHQWRASAPFRATPFMQVPFMEVPA